MNLEFQTKDGLLVVKVLNPRIDAAAVGQFREQMQPYLAEGHEKILVDIEDVDFIDSTGLGALVSLFKSLPPSGELAICGAREQVDSVFKLTRLNKVFLMCATVEEGMDRLRNPT